MSNAAPHTFTPSDNTLSARVAALKESLKAHRNIQASQEKFNDPQWANRIGTADELKYANKVAMNTVRQARQSFSEDEFNMAIRDGLIDEKDTKELKALDRQIEMKAHRQKNMKTNTRHRQKR